MGEIGSGGGSSYPTALDTNNTPEVNSPNAGKTKARAEVPNDLASAVVAIETELGTDPAGTLTDVTTYLQTEHQADGTHGDITPTSIAATGNVTSTGNVTATGDITADGLIQADGIVQADGGIKTDGTHTLITKILPIGAWDMDTALNANVAHGLSEHRDIRGLDAFIRSDDSTTAYAQAPWFTAAGQIDFWIQGPDSTNVQLTRRAGGFFDSVNYDLTEYNLDNAAAVDKGSGLVGIPITAHTFIDNDVTTIAGTTNYNDTYTIVSQTANEIVITATFAAETFAGTETASWSRGWVSITYIP
jgi:hypothetical protein